MHRSLSLDRIFLSLLAACGGSRPAPATSEPPPQDPIDAGTPGPVATVPTGTAPATVTVVPAPTVNGGVTGPVDRSFGRWAQLPVLDVQKFVRSHAASLIAVDGRTLPPGLDYLRIAEGCNAPVARVWTGATPPSAAEIEAAIAQSADSILLWHRNGVWYRGSVADALLPLKRPSDVALYLALQCVNVTGVYPSKDGFETIFVVPEPGDCPHSDPVWTSVLLAVSPDGTIRATAKEQKDRGSSAPCVGRDTEGSPRGTSASVPLDPHGYFDRLARDEAVSIDSFVRLAAELQAAGAPADLVERARQAAEDETRHAAEMTSMCETFGPRPSVSRRTSLPTRDRLAMLVENAREGCVNETFAALVATHQAEAASERSARELFSRIAADERRHAELAWDIDAWGRTQISEVERAAVDRARVVAYDELEAFLAQRPDRGWFASVGEPDAALALALARGLRTALAA